MTFLNYSYPLDETWDTKEIVDVVTFFQLIEKAYESNVKSDELMLAYTRFKQIVPSKSEEKQLFSKFEKDSGYAAFPVVKKAKEDPQSKIKM